MKKTKNDGRWKTVLTVLYMGFKLVFLKWLLKTCQHETFANDFTFVFLNKTMRKKYLITF